MAAGQGTRMRSALPKVLHPVAGRPMVRHVVDAAREAGVTRCVVVVGHGAEQVRAALGGGVLYAEQPERLGTGDAVRRARAAADGVRRLLVLNGDAALVTGDMLRLLMDRHVSSGAALTLLTARVADPAGLGRVVRGPDGGVARVVEDPEAGDEARTLDEVNTGLYCFDAAWLWAHLPRLERSAGGEYYLTDLVGLAVAEGAPVQAVPAPGDFDPVGINDRVQLARAEAALRRRFCERLMRDGVTIIDPATTYVEAGVQAGRDTVIYPNTHLQGETRIGQGCHIGPNSVVRDSTVGDRCRIEASYVEGSTLEPDVLVGPFSHVRPGSYLESGVHLGNYAEVKNSRIGAGTQQHHFSYVGDAQVGRDVNIGAGTITCNYDGREKHRTVIGDRAFIGSDTMLIAPVRVGDGASTGAGSVVNRDVPADSLAVGVPARIRRKPPPEDP